MYGVALTIDKPALQRFEKIVRKLYGGGVDQVLGWAAKRAADTASKVGRQKIKEKYYIKPGYLRRGISIVPYGTSGAMMIVRGWREYVGHYKAKPKAKGIFVAVKRGNLKLIPKSFNKGINKYTESQEETFFKRLGFERFPIKKLCGPAVPQLFGNPEVLEEMSKAALERYAQRAEHELLRVMKEDSKLSKI